MEKVILLRCHPKKLKKRLLGKKWSAQKVIENVDAEALDVILCEAVEIHLPKNIFEIDTTNRTITEVALTVREIVNTHFEPTESYTVGQIDWSEEIIKKKGR
jgi:adenylate kinase